MAGIDAFGTQLQRGDGAATEVFTAIANITSIDPPSIERETLDVTTHGSPDQWREHLGGLKDGGEVSFDLNYDPTEHDTLVADFDDTEARNYKVVWPASLGSWEFAAILTGFEPSAPHDEQLTASVTLKVSGKPVLTTGA